MTPFQALLVTQTDGKFDATIQKLQPEALPPGDVLIRYDGKEVQDMAHFISGRAACLTFMDASSG